VRSWAVCWCALACACGRIGFDPFDSLDPLDEELPPFGPPLIVEPLSSGGDIDDVTLTGDMLEVYFESTRSGGAGADDIWYSVRASTSDPWPVPVNAAALNSAAQDGHPGLSADGLTIWLASDRGASQKHIFVATRATRADPWSTPVLVSELSDAGNNEGPQVDPSGTRMVLVWGTQNVSEDIYESRRTSPTSAWSMPMPVLGVDINSTATDGGPGLDGSGLYIYFSSRRFGSSYDLFVAHRPRLDAPFEAVAMLPELGTDRSEGDPWISADRRHIFWTVNDADLYEASR
jgi:hypothetical protein